MKGEVEGSEMGNVPREESSVSQIYPQACLGNGELPRWARL